MPRGYHQRTGKLLNNEGFINELCERLKICEPMSIRAFETQIIYELRPDGDVVERKLYLNRFLENGVKLPVANR